MTGNCGFVCIAIVIIYQKDISCFSTYEFSFPILYRLFPRNMVVCWTWSHSPVRTSLLIMSSSGYPPNQGAFSTEQSRYPSHSVQYTFPSTRHQQVSHISSRYISTLWFHLFYVIDLLASNGMYLLFHSFIHLFCFFFFLNTGLLRVVLVTVLELTL